MPGLDLGIHVFTERQQEKTWMAGSPSAKTRFALLPGHDELYRPFAFRHSAKSFSVCSSVAG
jgi:hypothetical protein